MNFVTTGFLIFTLLTLAFYWILKDRYRTSILLVASYVFYAFWDWRFTSLLALLTASNYLLTKKMNSSISAVAKKRILIICLGINLVVLAIFKYLNFFSESYVDLLSALGFAADFPTVSIILPLGLSFFIFQTSSYIVDVYRGQLIPEKSFINFATFVVYFPHMAAGPIMPAKVLIPQIASPKTRPNLSRVQSGLLLIAIGLFRKIVIADTLAPMVNRVLDNPDDFDWKSLLLASVGFGLQIYGDFAGYSAIARGVSRLFGIEMMVNFRQPYLATSITDFWRRWHISLSTWFRDYLYVPLGGNQKGKTRTYINLVIVMTIAGLWHGAAAGFILWGLLHGLFLILDKIAIQPFSKFRLLRSCLLVPGWLITQTFVFFAWVFFRNPEISTAFNLIESIFNRAPGTFEISDALLVCAAIILSFTLDLVERFLAPRITIRSDLILGIIIGSLVVISLVLKSSTVVPFIYFRF